MQVTLQKLALDSLRLCWDYDNPPASDAWSSFIADILTLVCTGKTTYLLTYNPGADSPVRTFMPFTEVNINKRSYGINVVEEWTSQLTEWLAHSWEFELSNIIVVHAAVGKSGPIPIDALFKSVNHPDEQLVQQLGVPVIFRSADGQWLDWVKIAEPMDDIRRHIVELAHHHGIKVTPTLLPDSSL